MENKTNWIAIITSVVCAFFIGFLWYGFLFKNLWMAGNGYTMEGDKMFKNGTEIMMDMTPMFVNVIGLFVYAWVMNWLINKTGSTSLQSGMMLGAIVGLTHLIGVIVGNLFAANPMSLSLVNGSYMFVLFIAMGSILGGWRK